MPFALRRNAPRLASAAGPRDPQDPPDSHALLLAAIAALDASRRELEALVRAERAALS